MRMVINNILWREKWRLRSTDGNYCHPAQDRVGAAAGGTPFLDELGDIERVLYRKLG